MSKTFKHAEENEHRPVDVCYCGHTGGTEYSQHDARYAEGHGACRVKWCDCKQFTWKSRSCVCAQPRREE